MQRDDLNFDFEGMTLKADDTGEFEGLASVYGNVDNQGDRIMPGAFAADNGREVPILWSHKRDEVIGVGRLEDGPDGVRIKGRFLLDTVAGREAWTRAKSGAARGLSVGLRILEKAAAGAVRLIQRGRIVEVSLTAFPANELATVTGVKSDKTGNGGAGHFRDLARLL